GPERVVEGHRHDRRFGAGGGAELAEDPMEVLEVGGEGDGGRLAARLGGAAAAGGEHGSEEVVAADRDGQEGDLAALPMVCGYQLDRPVELGCDYHVRRRSGRRQVDQLQPGAGRRVTCGVLVGEQGDESAVAGRVGPHAGGQGVAHRHVKRRGLPARSEDHEQDADQREAQSCPPRATATIGANVPAMAPDGFGYGRRTSGYSRMSIRLPSSAELVQTIKAPRWVRSTS